MTSVLLVNKKLSCRRETARVSCHWIFCKVNQDHSKRHCWEGRV